MDDSGDFDYLCRLAAGTIASLTPVCNVASDGCPAYAPDAGLADMHVIAATPVQASFGHRSAVLMKHARLARREKSVQGELVEAKRAKHEAATELAIVSACSPSLGVYK